MAIFKRFEVWLLLVLSIAGVGYVLWSEKQAGTGNGSPDTPEPDPEVAEETTKRFKIREVRRVAEGENQVIEIELLGRNRTKESEELTPEKVRLLAKYEGDTDELELPSFFLPFDPPPTLAANSESIVTLKYWLEPRIGNRNPSLRLEVLDESLEIPDVEKLKNDSGGKFGGTRYQF